MPRTRERKYFKRRGPPGLSGSSRGHRVTVPYISQRVDLHRVFIPSSTPRLTRSDLYGRLTHCDLWTSRPDWLPARGRSHTAQILPLDALPGSFVCMRAGLILGGQPPVSGEGSASGLMDSEHAAKGSAEGAPALEVRSEYSQTGSVEGSLGGPRWGWRAQPLPLLRAQPVLLTQRL